MALDTHLDLSSPEILEGLQKSLEEWAVVIKVCKEKDHPNALKGMMTYFRGSLSVSMDCPDCHLPYQRSATFEEYRDFQRDMHIPMTL
ncbi:MAG: hypothetical protein Q8R18_01265 [bacterium]|nr:hypothetical protein [bacterium]